MASVNIPFNLDTKQIGQQSQIANRRVVTNFYAYQDPNSGFMPETQIKNEHQEQELCFKKTLLIVIIALSSISLAKSCVISCIKLSKNIALTYELKTHEKKLKESKQKLEAKIKTNNSYSGIKKMIRQEIKALDANEILVRFES